MSITVATILWFAELLSGYKVREIEYVCPNFFQEFKINSDHVCEWTI